MVYKKVNEHFCALTLKNACDNKNKTIHFGISEIILIRWRLSFLPNWTAFLAFEKMSVILNVLFYKWHEYQIYAPSSGIFLRICECL